MGAEHDREAVGRRLMAVQPLQESSRNDLVEIRWSDLFETHNRNCPLIGIGRVRDSNSPPSGLLSDRFGLASLATCALDGKPNKPGNRACFHESAPAGSRPGWPGRWQYRDYEKTHP